MTGVVGRAALLSALFLLWSLLSYARGRWLPAVLLTLLAHGCKETGLLGFPLFIWMELACPSLVRQPPGGWPGPCRRSSLRCAASVLLLCAHVLLRVHLLELLARAGAAALRPPARITAVAAASSPS